MANTGNTTLSTDFNVSPYYDDYDTSKEFYRILYKPGYAVQARELTQSQTILQKQVARIGTHLFKEGSMVVPGAFGIYTANSTSGSVYYVKVNDVDSSNTTVSIDNFLNQTITGQTTGIKAEISDILDGTQSSSNTKTIYVDYRNVSNSNSDIKTFQSGEILTCNAGTLVVHSTDPTGEGSAFTISEGVFYAKEHFIHFPTQRIILDRYNNSPSCRVGFTLLEEIITFSDDQSLLDPALESSNYSAPGADRLKLNAVLTVKPYNETETSADFITLVTIDDGIITKSMQRPQYNILADEMAKRTFDESGHYYVNGLEVNLREHLDDGTNGGRFLSANGGNANLISVQVSPGTAYVSGYEIGTLNTLYLSTPKSSDFQTITSQLSSAALGSYVTVNEFTGSWGLDQGTVINLYDKSQTRLTSQSWSTGAQTGNLIGNAVFVSVEHNTGTMGTPSAKFDVYLTDIKMLGSNTFSNVKSIYYDNASTSDMGADIVLNASNNAILQDVTNNPSLYYVGSNFTKTLKPNNISDTIFTYGASTTVANVSPGTFNLSLPSGADQFPYGTTNLTDTQKRQIIIALNADGNVALSGTVSNSGTTLTGVGTNFNLLNVGDKISMNGISGIYYISSIASATSLTLNTTLAKPATGNTFVKQYKNGDIIDLTSLGATGVERTVSATSSQLSFDLKETIGGLVPATVSYRVSKTAASQINKTLRPNRYVKIDTANNSGNTTGPYNLGIPDVYRIRSIRANTGGSINSNTEGSNLTSQFIFDNGQRDYFYDHASITPKTSLPYVSHLLVELDYFEPDFTVGQGFFSVDSYPINDSTTSNTTIKTAEIPFYRSSSSNKSYDLRNYLDFRPIKTRTATDTTSIGSASENPAISSTFNKDVNGLRIPAPSSEITYDYQYYLARKDVVTVNKDNIFNIERGVSASFPITPAVSDSVMPLATITIPPYPSLSLFYANQINRRDLACSIKKTASVRFTMRDIGVLKDRIINLEYYASLSLLEKSALELTIPDAEGLDRFKNGIFVDTFASDSLAAKGQEYPDSECRITFDPDEKSIRPIYSMDSFHYNYNSGTNVKKTGDIVTLNYSEVVFLEQTNATTTRNTERTTYRFNGFMTLIPDSDIWVSTEDAPDQVSVLNLRDAYESNSIPLGYQAGLTTTWNSWQTYVTGYRVYRGDSINPANLIGTYQTSQQAQAIASTLRSSTAVTIETMRASTRVGTEYWTENDIQSTSLGNKIIDVDIVPYIKPQNIKIICRELKPFARYYTFFDNVNLSNYVTSLTETEYNSNTTVTFSSSEGSAIIADANGVVRLSLRIPNETGKKFYTGTKEVRLTDSPTNTDDATSVATGYFVAQGLVQTQQETILSTRQVINKRRNVIGSRTDPSLIENLPVIVPDPGDGGGSAVPVLAPNSDGCAAYSFVARTPYDEEGMFITSIDVFCAEKHPELGVWFEILEVDDTGQVTQNQVPFSAVWYTTDQVPISTDGKTNPLNIKFQSPVFLQKDKLYALAIHPEAINPNYYFWVSRIGQTDVNSNVPVNSRLYTGTFYTTNNGIVWQIVPDIDLTFKAYRASFDTNVDGVINLGSKGRDKFVLSNVTSTLSTHYGKALKSNTNNVTTTLSKSYETASKVTAIFENSNGAFSTNTIMFMPSANISANIAAIENFRYSLADLEPAYLKFGKTSVDFQMKTWSNTGTEGSFITINPSDNYYFEDERAIFSRSTEIGSYSSANTNQVKVTMRSSSNYLSPVLDLGRTHVVLVDNFVNSNTTNETNPSGGYLYNKYISKVITLAEGQDAEDMLVYLTSYRPPGTDVKVYVRLLNAEDGESINKRPWIEMQKSGISDGVYSSLSDKGDFVEYKYEFPSANLTGSLGEVQYRNTANTTTFTGYKNFAVKIGLLSDNSAIVPRVADLRVIALQK